MIRPSAHAGYKSPVHKLIRFFEDSRDNWKAKYQALKKDHKRLENRVRFLERSKTDVKKEAHSLRQQLKQSLKQQATQALLKKSSVDAIRTAAYAKPS